MNYMTDELQLYDSRDWHSVFDALVESVLILNKDKVVVHANRAACQLLSTDDCSLLGRTCHELFVSRSTVCKDCPLEYVQHKGESYTRDMERPFLGKCLRVTCAPMFREDEFVGYIHSAVDITHQLNLEKQLVFAQKMKAISTLAGGIAHDFNNILGVILGNADLLEFRLEGNVEQLVSKTPMLEKEEILEHLAAIQKAGQRAQELVGQILTFSRQATSQRKDVLITPIIKEGIKFLQSTVPATIEVRASLAEDIGYIYADPTQIHQALMNLCTNAVEAIGDAHGHIEISLAETKISNAELVASMQKLKNGEYIVLSVKDTGIGMTEDVLERIYDPYFSTRESGAETGLGLAVLHGIVSEHNAYIDVSSEPGKGSVFSIYFPKVNTRKEKRKKNVASTMLQGTETIIFADDEKELVKMFSEMLGYLGYTIIPAFSGQEVLDHLKNGLQKVDMVITDQTMPNMTGMELAFAVKKIRRNLPVILCSGYTEPVTEKSAKQAGINAFLAKPIEMKDLAVTMRQVFLLSNSH